MDPRTFDNFRNLIYEKSGISLNDSKKSLMCSRMGKRMRSLGIDSHRMYLKHVIQDESGQEIVYLLDAISTNVTRFFREPDHFQFLEKTMKEWFKSGQQRFRIWSAACSTGEEPYSIAMTILESGGSKYDFKILATDISTRALETARRGIYEVGKMEQISKKHEELYFDRILESNSGHYMVKSALRRMIVFGRLNLSTPPFPMNGPLDVVFCRNVMIYFDNQVRHRLLKEICQLLKSGGYLIVGHAESLIGLTEDLKSVQPSVYMKI